MTTGISWTDETWNPVVGCTRVSTECLNCYAEHAAAMVNRTQGKRSVYLPVLRYVNGDPRWNGKVRLVVERLMDPIRWRRPRQVFTNSMGDLFHEELPDEAIDRVVAVMLICALRDGANHIFQTLTKRSKRLRSYLNDRETILRVARAAGAMMEDGDAWFDQIAFRPAGLVHPNLWWGVSAGTQEAANERIPDLLATQAAVRFVSCEPLLSAVDLAPWIFVPTRCRSCGATEGAWYDTNPDNLPPLRRADGTAYQCQMGVEQTGEPGAIRCAKCDSLDIEEQSPLDWVIVGCESGDGARDCDIEWLRSLRDQCATAGTAFFLKQAETADRTTYADPGWWVKEPGWVAAHPIVEGPGSKRKRGRVIELPYLDGVQHTAMPEVDGVP